jgi:asparagine synthase (glutamine-hydrolysing)
MAGLDPVQKMMFVDTQVLLPDIFLEKVDKPTMAWSVEARVPFLDARLAERVMALPASMKVQGHKQKKRLLRLALRGVVPDDILDGPKTGFSVPVYEWLRGPLLPFLKEVVLDRSFLDWGLYGRDRMERAIEEHVAGGRNNGPALYLALQLGIWRELRGVS